MAGEGLFLGLLIAAIIAILVYYDAKQRNLINNPWIKTASGWAIGVFFYKLFFYQYTLSQEDRRKENYMCFKKSNVSFVILQ